MNLTDTAIRRAKSKDKAYKMYDGRGLYLQIEPSGGKLWRFKYQFGGKEKLLSMGKYPDISLATARQRHQEARTQIAQGIDPSAARKAQKAAGEQRAANSFEVVAREWFATWKSDKAESTSEKVIARLEKDVFPYIGSRPIAEIKAPEILAVLQRIESRGIIDTAHKAKYSISQTFRYAVASGRAEHDPCPDLRGALKPIRGGHFASITEPAKVAELLRAIEAYKGSPVVRAALRLAPLVFVRPGELRQAKWADIDLDRAEWKYIPPKTRKLQKSHIVPLARQAVEILRELHPLTGYGEYVFPNVRPGRAMSGATINRALQTIGYDTKTEMTGHGFRAMARTILAERLNVPVEVIEHQLAHQVADPLGTAYNRTQFLAQRITAMQEWADYLDKLKAGQIAGMVPFPAAG